jgi:hypothetical protein
MSTAEIQRFMSSVGSAGQDSIVSAVNDMLSMSSDEKIRNIEYSLDNVKKQIDIVNKTRESMNDDIDNIKRVVSMIEKSDAARDSLFFEILKQVLLDTSVDIRIEIAKMRPEEDLRTKHELGIALDRMTQRRKTAQMLLAALKRA